VSLIQTGVEPTPSALAKELDIDQERALEILAQMDSEGMFDEIAKRAANEQTKFDAGVKRDQMLDLLTILEDNLRNARPTSAGGQGPKTREAIRNRLAGGETKNALIDFPKVEIRGVNRE
jgi:hypothetical protein